MENELKTITDTLEVLRENKPVMDGCPKARRWLKVKTRLFDKRIELLKKRDFSLTG